MENLRFVLIEDGHEQQLVVNKPLLTIPGTGDEIQDAVGDGRYKVESVIHTNIFGSPGDHTITVNLVKL